MLHNELLFRCVPRMNTEFYEAIITDLYTEIGHITLENAQLQEKLTHTEIERDFYFNQCKSYELWQNRSIARLKEMQNG